MLFLDKCRGDYIQRLLEIEWMIFSLNVFFGRRDSNMLVYLSLEFKLKDSGENLLEKYCFYFLGFKREGF